MEYPTADQIFSKVVRHLVVTSNIDIDELVYDKISDFDHLFEDGCDWYDEEGSDEKDSLRDQVLEMLGMQDC